MPKKVYELAKELGVASKELLEKAAKLGIKVESHMSVLSDTDVKRLSAKGGAARPVGKAVPGQVSGRVGPVGRPIVNDSYFENKRKAPAGRPVVDDDFLARREKQREEAKEEGIKEGSILATVKYIRILMQSSGMNFEEACKLFGLTEEEISAVKEKMD